MKNAFKKLLSTILLTIICISLAACVDPEDVGKVSGVTTKPGAEQLNTQVADTTKAQLYISNFNGGYGSEFLVNAINRFCEMYKDTEFIPGTKGVQIWVDQHKGLNPETMNGSRDEIYFLENMNYYDMLYSGYLLDITDMVTEKLTAYGENQSIEDKIPETYRNYFKTEQGKYYALPHYVSGFNITYDIDVMDKNSLFRSEDGEFNCTSTSPNLSSGPDGKKGTYDDGLPATYDEFYELCDAMKRRSVTPIGWSGMYDFYITTFMAQLKADFEGSEAPISYIFDGTATKLVDSINSDGSINYMPATTITPENGYLMFKSAGSYYSYKFIEGLLSGNYYYSRSFNGSISHMDIQSIYLLSRFKQQTGIGSEGMAMLVEGEWWVNEASATFGQMKTYKNASLAERRIALMPLPKATQAQVGEKQTILDANNSLCCISAFIAPEKITLAKKFLQFMETNESLCEFFVSTNTPRAYSFDYSGIYDSLCPYAKSVLNLYYENAEIVLPLSSSRFFYKNYSEFNSQIIMQTKEHITPARDMSKGVTANQLFSELNNKYSSSMWTNMLNK